MFDLLQPIKRFWPPMKMKKGSCSADGKAASQVHFFDRAADAAAWG